MKRVWLLRHAKSSWDDPDLADHDRPLAPRGRKAAARLAQWLHDNEVRPGLVLCSTALRAKTTLDLVLTAIGRPHVVVEAGLYHAPAADLLQRLRTLPPDLAGVLLVGHNPGLHDLASLLAPPGPDAFPTGALTQLRLEIGDWPAAAPGSANAEWLVVPRSLRHAG